MLHQIALEYLGYLIESPIAVDTEIGQLDMTALTMHYYSSGPCDPILESGLYPRYRIVEIDIPEWAKPMLYMTDYDYRARVIAIGETNRIPESLFYSLTIQELSALSKLLAVKNFKSDFIKSLRNQAETWINSQDNKYNSPLSPRQFDALIRAYHIR
jgi:hypothetical protein